MLSAPKKGQAGNSLDFFPFKSLYKVLDSMQDLRQHIEGLSLDEIVEADEKAKRLILRLSSLQTGLANLDTVKQFLSKVEGADPTPPVEIGLEPQTPLPNLEAIRQLLGKTRETILNEAVENKSAPKTTLPSVDILKEVLAKAKETTLTELVETKIEPRKEIAKKNPQGQGAKIPSNLIPFPGPSKIAKEESKLASGVSSLPSQHREGAKEHDTPLEKALSLAESQLAVEDQTSKANSDTAGDDKEKSSATQVNAFTLGENQLGEKKFELGFDLEPKASQEKNSFAAEGQAIPSSHTSPSASKRDGETAKLVKPFDQELLDNLIKDYGEFTIYTKLSAETKTVDVPVLNQLQPQSQLPPRPAPKTDLIFDSDTRSWQKKEVALDKKLKKLMTAYGKVDKYSTNRSAKLKKVAVGIIVLIIIAVISVSFISFRQASAPTAQSGAPTVAATETSNSLVPSSTSTTTPQPTKKLLTAEAEKQSPAKKSAYEKEE